MDDKQERTLTGADRRYLRGLANPRKVLVQVGESGMTDQVIGAVEAALRDHELIKVRIAGDRDERRRVAEQLEAAADCELAGMVGGVAIYYRPADDPADRGIRLPSSRA